MPESRLRAERAAPRPRLVDHLRVAWLLVGSFAGVIPFTLFLLLSPVLTPWLRARTKQKLAAPPAEPAAPPEPLAVPEDGTIFIVAGEASGDALAASVIARLRAEAPGVHIRGYGGPACAAAGAVLDEDIVENAVFGFFPVVASLGFWWKLCARTLARLREDPPDLLLTIDFPGLNVRLARWARERGVRTVHLVAPQIWAHTPWRIFRWRKAVDRVLANFPHEPALFASSGIATSFVGHPLFEAPLPAARTPAVPPADEARIIELWPGSRRREIDRLTPLLVEAASIVEARFPRARFVVRLARPAHEARFRHAQRSARWAPANLSFTAEPRPTYDAALWGALASSGTATAQLAVDLVPLAAVYRLGFISWLFGQVLVTSPFIALPNIVLGRRAVPERLCWAPDAGERVARDFLAAAGDAAAWAGTRAALGEVRRRLEAPDVAERAAGWVLAEFAQARAQSRR